MDCEGAPTKLETPIYAPKQTMGTDMDLILAYQKMWEETKHTVSIKWVMGHVSIKRKYQSKITPMEWENEDYDEAANEQVKSIVKAEHVTPLPGFGAILQLDGEWVIAHFQECVRYLQTIHQ